MLFIDPYVECNHNKCLENDIDADNQDFESKLVGHCFATIFWNHDCHIVYHKRQNEMASLLELHPLILNSLKKIKDSQSPFWSSGNKDKIQIQKKSDPLFEHTPIIIKQDVA